MVLLFYAKIKPVDVRQLHARALSFDLDGVLVHSRQAVDEAWTSWAKQPGLSQNAVCAQFKACVRATPSLRLLRSSMPMLSRLRLPSGNTR
jgi:beta-phosphoglucomutase-like phosphatase (HAD superfamily)